MLLCQLIKLNQQMIKQYDCLFKIVIVGNSSVGKSSILRRFSEDQFQQSYLATIGVDFRFKSLNINGDQVKLQIWDTAGQERFRTITSAYFKMAQGIFMVYDLTSETSFTDITQFWTGEVEKYAEPNVVIWMVGNKTDQTDNRFNNAHVIEYCKSKGISHSEVSAKTGDGIEAAFRGIAEKLTSVYPKEQKKDLSQSQIIARIMRKKNQFKLKSGTLHKVPEKKKCC